jgi:hypothetical protein
MPTLEELLRASLKGANEKFDQANKTLHAAVVEAAKAVEAVTEGKATLRLVTKSSNEDGTQYRLVIIDKDGNQKRRLANLTVPLEGYPITRIADPASSMAQIKSPEELATYFQKLASDPDSPLVAYLAYIARNPSEEK